MNVKSAIKAITLLFIIGLVLGVSMGFLESLYPAFKLPKIPSYIIKIVLLGSILYLLNRKLEQVRKEKKE